MFPTTATRMMSLALAAGLGLGCTSPGVSLRADGSPGPQDCPAKALEVMRILRLRPGDSASLVIDANQSSQTPVSLPEGPVESYITEDLGYLPPLTRMYGHIWTGGPNAIIRYFEARPPDGDPVPLCAVARLGRGGLQKKPGSPPGVAVVDFARAQLFIVDGFR
jgi:hypothetical protein